MIDYEEAPYLELDNYKAPKGIKCIFIPMDDNKKIRLAYWQNSSMQSKIRGTVLLQQGHNEFIEKYYETIQELLDRNFHVICFDWRGQGMSDRMTNDIHKQYIEDFTIHDNDLFFIVKKFININLPKPLIVFGHSMGGCLILSVLPKLQNDIKAVILSAPMLGFKNEKLLNILIGLFSFFVSSKSYFPGSKPNMGLETPFEKNDLTTDYKRYRRTQNLVRKLPDIRLWGVTYAWVKAVKKRFNKIRKENWAENIKNDILIINSLKDRVVSSKKIIEMHKRLPNSKIINYSNAEHEVLMEDDKKRAKFWKNFDEFMNKLSI